ncbi:MAG: hypothetical protein M3361_15140 [Candidatus Tectomicrobia bacterium]|nr:hypothetical protein [Candidatus Tectomicrobia bacterium]
MARSPEVTLLDVIRAVREVAANEQETLATVVHLLTSGQVRLPEEAISGLEGTIGPGACRGVRRAHVAL